jgi:Zn-dependent protease
MMGWASAPYDRDWGQRHPRRLAAMSVAGPAANLTLALAAFAILRALLASGYFVAPPSASFSHVVAPAPEHAGSGAGAVALLLSVALNLNVLLCLFNLLPLPPLDGAGVVQGLFPDSIGGFIATLSGNPMFSLAGLVVAWRVFDLIFPRAFSIVLALLHPGMAYS